MSKKIFAFDASMRPTTASNAVITNSPISASVEIKTKKSDTKKSKRNLFTVAKSKAIALFEKVEWIAGDDAEERTKLFKKCVKKAIADLDGYNESAFKKDMAMHMAFLLNDRRFQHTCWMASWSLFEVSQRLCWTKAAVFQQIRDYGLDHVHGFETPDILVYELPDLEKDLRALGFDGEFFKDDPYTAKYKKLHPEYEGPISPVAKALEEEEVKDAEVKQGA